jgi:DNA-binding NarL/FixJ family response regulator
VLLSKLKKRIKEIAPDLELRKVSTPLDSEKLEILRNLFESGISEEMIAEQLDIDIDTVKLAIHEMSKTT